MKHMTDLVMYQCESYENVKEIFMMSPHVQSYHESQMQTINMNTNLNANPKNKCNCCETFVSQQNIMTCQDTSHETFSIPIHETIKK